MIQSEFSAKMSNSCQFIIKCSLQVNRWIMRYEVKYMFLIQQIDNFITNRYQEIMNWSKQQNLSKKKSKLSPGGQYSFNRQSQSKNRNKTENSPPRSLSKDQIKNTIKKIVYNQGHAYSNSNHSNFSGVGKLSKNNYMQPKEQISRSRKMRSRLQIAIPYLQSSLTPKNCNGNRLGERQVRSTKAADNKMFQSSGRYDLKKLLDCKNEVRQRENYRNSENRITYSQGKQYGREYGKDSSKDFSRMKVSSPSSKNKGEIVLGNKVKEREEQTTKLIKQDQFDPKSCLTAEEYDKFGDRFPQKFKRVALLGRGGFSVVWLGIHKSTKRKFAVKQILSKNPHETHLKEIWFGSYFFEKGGQPRQQFEDHIGINNICRLFSFDIRSLDSWLYYEICQESLGSCLFELKGETLANNQRIYKIQYKQFIQKIREDIGELKHLIVEIAKALHLINSHNIVHSDLKTENILLKTRKSTFSDTNLNLKKQPFIKELKLIDFGSSFLFTNLKQFSMATPEYMPPQILNYILYQNKLQYDVLMLNKMQKYKNPWVIDVWSLGCIVLQIIAGLPLWMSLPTKIEETNTKVSGLFAVKGRLFNKIIQKQINVVQNLSYHLSHNNHSGIVIDQKINSVLIRMLSLNPDERISPMEILNEFGVSCRPQKIPSY